MDDIIKLKSVLFMKKMFCIISIALVNGLLIYSQTLTKDAYEFPVKPRTEEWGQFETIEKRIAALQVSDAVLETISTASLLETCLAYPYLTNLFFCDNYQQGFESLTKEFTISEILSKPLNNYY